MEDSCDGGTVNAKKHDLQKQTVKAHIIGLYVYRRLVYFHSVLCVTSVLLSVCTYKSLQDYDQFIFGLKTLDMSIQACFLNTAKALFLCYCLGLL